MNYMPVHATADSQRLFEIARDIANACPPEIGQVIALTGSASRGVSDEYSDVELNFWVDELHHEEAYIAWLKTLNIEHIPFIRKLDDGSLSLMGWQGDIFVETAWQSFADLDRSIETLMSGKLIGPYRMGLAYAVVNAMPIRGAEQLAEYQGKLATYPNAMQTTIIGETLKNWALFHNWPDFIIGYWPWAARNARLDLARRHAGGLCQMMYMLFALNRMWEPDLKWLEPECAKLALKPVRLIERVNFVFSSPDAMETTREFLSLMLDILNLIPSHFDTSEHVEFVKRSLKHRKAY